MRRAVLVLLCLLLLPVLALAQPQAVLLQNAQSTGTGTGLTTTGLSVVTVSITGSAGADRVVTFQGSVDGNNFASILCTSAQTGATATSATVSGTILVQWRCPVAGFLRFQTSVGGGATGTVTVYGLGSTVSAGLGGGVSASADAIVQNLYVGGPKISSDANGPGAINTRSHIVLSGISPTQAQLGMIFSGSTGTRLGAVSSGWISPTDALELVVGSVTKLAFTTTEGRLTVPLTFASVTQTGLAAAIPTNGQQIYCSDCQISAGCASGGGGAMAKRIAGGLVCN